MNVYLIQTKYFYTSNGVEYQVADALNNILVVSSYKKAVNAIKDYEEFLSKQGYKRTSKYNDLFPHEHFTMINNEKGFRAVTSIIKEEVE